MSGPPFAVSDAEVRTLYAGHGKLELLEQREIIEEETKWRERGLQSIVEASWLFEAT